MKQLGGQMIVELISVGSELLLGDILNTNVQFLSQEIADLGFDIYHTSVVGDNSERLYEAIDLAMSRCDVLILTGGLGATSDDITKPVVMEYVDRDVFLDEESRKVSQDWLAEDSDKEDNRITYIFPKGSKVLHNSIGIVSGAYIPLTDNPDKAIAIMPGVPREMKPMFRNKLLPILKERSSQIIESIVLKIGLIGEYEAFQRLEEEISEASNPTYAPYARDDGVSLRITAKADTDEEAKKLLQVGIDKAMQVYGDLIIEIGHRSKAEVLIDLLKERNEKVAIAESLTGGQISSLIIDVAGASDVISDGFVVYSEQAKTRRLGVDEKLIKEKTAVSEEVAQAMVEGLEDKTGDDLLIASTGYAGPTGERVGEVYLAISYKGDIEIYEHHFKGTRENIRRRTAYTAIDHAIMKMREDV